VVECSFGIDYNCCWLKLSLLGFIHCLSLTYMVMWQPGFFTTSALPLALGLGRFSNLPGSHQHWLMYNLDLFNPMLFFAFAAAFRG